MNEVTVFTILFALIGLLFIGISIPTILGRVPPNRYYGFRTKKTLSDPRIWYEANRLSGHDLLIAGAVVTASSLALLVLAQRWKPEYVLFTLLAVMSLSLAGALWHGHKIVSRL
jgi:uncharacterized membrane protein